MPFMNTIKKYGALLVSGIGAAVYAFLSVRSALDVNSLIGYLVIYLYFNYVLVAAITGRIVFLPYGEPVEGNKRWPARYFLSATAFALMIALLLALKIN